MPTPPTQYVRTARGEIAYKICGVGEIDLVWLQPMGRSIDLLWDYAPMARVMERLAHYSRLIVFDRRGTGVSDPLPTGSAPSFEDWTDDLRSILDTLGVQRIALIAERDAGGAGVMFAASHPERVRALVLGNTSARIHQAQDYPIGVTEERVAFLAQKFAEEWGTEPFAARSMPSLAHDPLYVHWMTRMQRVAYTPRRAHAEFVYSFNLDTRAVLHAIHCPALVLHRRDFQYLSIEHARYLAAHITGARLEILDGGETQALVPGEDDAQNLIEEFLTGTRVDTADNRVLATVLFTDISGSTERAAQLGDARWGELLQRHHDIVRTEIGRFRGREVDNAGDGFFVQFDGPARALRCAQAVRARLRDELQIEVRAGAHTGECERLGDKLSGLAVHIGARIQGVARAGEILVSQTVRDLVTGSGLVFREAGVHELRGIPDRWPLYALD